MKMGTNLNTSSLTNLVFLATVSSSVLNLPYDFSHSLVPKIEANYSHYMNIADWKDNAFNNSPDYTFQDEDSEKIQTIIEFSQKVIENSTDVESEYVDIVNEDFWDLI